VNRTAKLSLIILSAIIAMGGFLGIQKQRVGASQRRLAEIVSEISTVTLYDFDGTVSPDSNTLATAISAAFPVNVFSRAASAATCKGGMTIWKDLIAKNPIAPIFQWYKLHATEEPETHKVL